ncbi:MAG TPA: hypothetical protein VJ783_08205 [Pirellulales bacterium]|nr:hypothetical protein [Pirellulales bacterium]
MLRIQRCRLLCATVGLALATGCSKGSKERQFDLTPVSGVIMLDGKPLADAEVGFYYLGAAPEGFPGSTGRTDAQGKYELQTGTKKGTIAGQYRVTVSRLMAPGGVTLNPSEGLDMGQLAASGQVTQTVPARYTGINSTDLATTVETSKSDGYNFDLKSQ